MPISQSEKQAKDYEESRRGVEGQFGLTTIRNIILDDAYHS